MWGRRAASTRCRASATTRSTRSTARSTGATRGASDTIERCVATGDGGARGDAARAPIDRRTDDARRRRQLIERARASDARALERCARAATAIDGCALETSYAACEIASASCGFRILSNSQFLEKRVDERDDDEVDGGGKERAMGETRETEDGETHEGYAEAARRAMEAIRGRWAETRDGGLALTGNKHWRPLPAVIGTTAYYHDESCGLDPKVAKNPNPARWGTYISSDDEDSSEVSEDSSDDFESDISSEFVSSTSSEGEYSDMEDNLADIENNFGDVDGSYAMGDGGGGGLFSSVGLSSAAKKAAPSYALSFDDVFGDDVRKSKGGLFDDVDGDDGGGLFGGAGGKAPLAFAEPAASAPAKPPVAAPKKPKGLFDSDSDDHDGDLFGITRRPSGGDLFSEPITDPLGALKSVESKKTDAKTLAPPSSAVASMSIEPKKSPSALFDSDSDSDDGGLFSTKPKEVKKAPPREGLFD